MQLRLIQIALATLLMGPACSGEGSASNADDAGGNADGFVLTDVPPDAERLLVAPTAVTFADVPVGQTDLQTVVLTNGSTAELDLTGVSVVDSDAAVRFTTRFLSIAAEMAGWADLDGDGHAFELRDQPLGLAPGATLDISLQYRPTGEVLDCPDRAPAPCGFLLVAGQEQTVSVPLYLPR